LALFKPCRVEPRITHVISNNQSNAEPTSILIIKCRVPASAVALGFHHEQSTNHRTTGLPEKGERSPNHL